jgi:hypothetical protein
LGNQVQRASQAESVELEGDSGVGCGAYIPPCRAEAPPAHDRRRPLLRGARTASAARGRWWWCRLGRVNTRLGRVNTRLGRVNTRLGRVNTRLGRVNTHLGRVNTRLGRVNTHLGRVNTRLGRVNTHLGRVNTRLGRVTHTRVG